MKTLRQFLKYAVTSVFLGGMAVPALAVDQMRLDSLFSDLATAGPRDAPRIESEIALELARSGSDAMDLLLERGRAALEAGEISTAIEHLTALVDHAPEFAEGYNSRATAYFMAGYYGPAMADIAETLVREPRHFGALSGLATILEHTGDVARARDIVDMIEAIHPQMEGLPDMKKRLDLALGGQSL